MRVEILRGVSVAVLTTFGSLVAHAAPLGQPPAANPSVPPPTPPAASSSTPAPPPFERTPVAVLWMGELDPEVAPRIVEDVNAALARKQTVRPIDSGDDRRVLVDGGPTSKVIQSVRDAQALFARGKLADAATALESAEARLLTDVPLEDLQHNLAEVERGLLATYDQLGKNVEARRAALRLRMAPGTTDDVKVLVERHAPPANEYGAALPPVEIVSTPPGAEVYRDLQRVGVTPMTVEGGDKDVDFVDVEAPGFRRAHVPLGMGGQVQLQLAAEERLGVLVDRVRDQAPDAPPAEVAAIGKRVGAARVLVLLPDGPRKVLARWLDVQKAKWADASLRVDNAGQVAMERIAGYTSPNESGAGAELGPAPAPEAPPQPKKKSKLGMWGKWYTWVAAGAVVALVVGLLVAQNVGSDKLTIKSSSP